MKEIRRISGTRLDKLVLTMNGLPAAMSKNTLSCLSIFSIFLIMIEMLIQTYLKSLQEI